MSAIPQLEGLYPSRSPAQDTESDDGPPCDSQNIKQDREHLCLDSTIQLVQSGVVWTSSSLSTVEVGSELDAFCL